MALLRREGRGRATAAESVDDRVRRELREIDRGERARGGRDAREAHSGRDDAAERPTTRSRRRRALLGEVNVGRGERMASALIGSVLVAEGLRRRGTVGGTLAGLGGVLVVRGAAGRSLAYRALGRSTAPRAEPDEAPAEGRPRKQHGPNAVLDASDSIRVEHAVVVDRPLEELYAFWRDFENLPRIMRHLERVSVHDATRSTWVARAPAGRTVSWDAVVINEVPNELLAWKSLDGADVANAGSVHFTPAEEGTRVRVLLEYHPPAGWLGAVVASLFGEDPDTQVRDDLASFKRAMEEGAFRSGGDREVARPRDRDAAAKERKKDGSAATSARVLDDAEPPANPSPS